MAETMGTRVAGKVAIVCGAGSSQGGLGNGMAAAVLLAKEGAKVLAVDIEESLMDETRARIAGFGGEVEAFVCDISDNARVSAMVERCIELWGRVDILFNNVGIQGVGGPTDVSFETWDKVMDVNVRAMMSCCRAVIPHMLASGGGSIINNASVGAIRYSYPAVAYMASKGAVLSMSVGIGLQYAPQGIRCNSVIPGYIASERISSRLRAQYGDQWETELERRAAQVPSGKVGDPWDIGYAVLFLASDEAKFVNGTQLVVDGGQSMTTAGATGAAT